MIIHKVPLLLGSIYIALAFLSLGKTFPFYQRLNAAIDGGVSFVNYNYPGLVFAAFAMASFLFWIRFRAQDRRGTRVRFGLLINIALVVAPFFVITLIAMYFRFRAYAVLTEKF